MESRNPKDRSIIGERIRVYFTAPPSPSVVFCLSATAWSGIQVAVREKKINHRVISPLAQGLVEPHFDRNNIKDSAALAGVIKKDLARLHYSGEKAACLLPEPCMKVFIFSFESLPSSEKETLKLLRWRVKKQLPLLPEDIRLSYQIMNTRVPVKVLISLGRAAVLEEYEDVLSKAGAKAGVVTSPALSLLNLIDWDKEKDFILANIEADSASLVAVNSGSISLYRLKSFPADASGHVSDSLRVAHVITEIENTIHFLEDRVKRGLGSLWLRSSSAELQAALRSELDGRLPFPVREFDPPFSDGLSAFERGFLAPLLGQVL